MSPTNLYYVHLDNSQAKKEEKSQYQEESQVNKLLRPLATLLRLLSTLGQLTLTMNSIL